MFNKRHFPNNREKFDEMFSESKESTRDFLWDFFSANGMLEDTSDEYYSECHMCGKEMMPTKTGRCSHCETVWNS